MHGRLQLENDIKQAKIQSYHEFCPYSDLFYNIQLIHFNWLNL